jgi:hypothetical protein
VDLDRTHWLAQNQKELQADATKSCRIRRPCSGVCVRRCWGVGCEPRACHLTTFSSADGKLHYYFAPLHFHVKETHKDQRPRVPATRTGTLSTAAASAQLKQPSAHSRETPTNLPERRTMEDHHLGSRCLLCCVMIMPKCSGSSSLACSCNSSSYLQGGRPYNGCREL